MKRRNKAKGFAHQGLILLVVVVAAIAAVGYRVYRNNNSTTTSNIPATASTVTTPAKFSSKADIQKASKALDADSGADQLDPSQLDSAINQLL